MIVQNMFDLSMIQEALWSYAETREDYYVFKANYWYLAMCTWQFTEVPVNNV